MAGRIQVGLVGRRVQTLVAECRRFLAWNRVALLALRFRALFWQILIHRTDRLVLQARIDLPRRTRSGCRRPSAAGSGSCSAPDEGGRRRFGGRRAGLGRGALLGLAPSREQCDSTDTQYHEQPQQDGWQDAPGLIARGAGRARGGGG